MERTERVFFCSPADEDVMAGPVPAIRLDYLTPSKDVDARDIGVLSTPFFERLSTGMTR
jgi:hypothetical protein